MAKPKKVKRKKWQFWLTAKDYLRYNLSKKKIFPKKYLSKNFEWFDTFEIKIFFLKEEEKI